MGPKERTTENQGQKWLVLKCPVFLYCMEKVYLHTFRTSHKGWFRTSHKGWFTQRVVQDITKNQWFHKGWFRTYTKPETCDYTHTAKLLLLTGFGIVAL